MNDTTKTDNYLDFISKTMFRQYINSRENFILNCLIEMGYKSNPNDIEEIKKFIDINKIEMIRTNSFEMCQEKYIVRSKKLNYEKSKEFNY